jgi:hypothetical protein
MSYPGCHRSLSVNLVYLFRIHRLLSFFVSPDIYLIQPPQGAIHKAVPPSKIVIAGDSAGGGLSLTVLTVLRDMGLPLPTVSHMSLFQGNSCIQGQPWI